MKKNNQGIKLLSIGKSDYNVCGTAGSFFVDKEDADKIVAEYNYINKDLVVDWECSTFQDTENSVALGWVTSMSVKDDGIYGRITWTQEFDNYYTGNETLYIVPCVDLQDNHVTSLHHFSLTQKPSLINPVKI